MFFLLSSYLYYTCLLGNLLNGNDMQKLGLVILGLLLCLSVSAQYVEDLLPGYLCRTLDMPDDYEGKVVCSLVKKKENIPLKQAVLYIHGYNDYFFQQPMGDSIQAHGYQFYALDLRKYGRSLREHQDAFYCKSLTEYFADIDTALAVIRSEGHEKVILMAHSAGGLIASYYLHNRPQCRLVQGLILNSPFLDWNFGWLMEKVLLPVVSWVGNYFPSLTVQGGGDFSQYAASLLKSYRGEWDFNTDWKMSYAHPKRAGWIHAIHTAQQTLQKGADLPCPILLLSSSYSYEESSVWNDRYISSDIVLDVADIQKYGALLGPQVTPVTITGGIHDLVLSAPSVRKRVYEVLLNWLDER